MSTPPDALSVVICAYTEARWSDLQAAVGSVRSQDPSPLEVVVVIDHNPALLARTQESFADVEGVVVVANAEARGLSGARNTGIAVSIGSIVAFLDDDAAALPGWTAGLLAPYADPDVLAVGGRVVPRFDAARPVWLPEEFDWVVGCTYAGHREAAGPVRNLIGANMSVRRDVVDAIGGFRHSLGRTASLPAGCEETELFIRATQHFPFGAIWYQPEAAVTHRVPDSRATAKYFRARCFAEGISKTQISRLVGSRDGLASERAYTTRTLPRAFARELRTSARGGGAGGVARAATLFTGVATTAAGYAAARVPGSERWLASRTSAAPEFLPALVTQVDIAGGVTGLAPVDPDRDTRYARAIVLVRRDGIPLGVLDLAIGPAGLPAEALAAEIERALGVTAPIRGAGPRMGTIEPPPAPVRVHERDHAAIVIATRDRVDALRRCLESLRRLDHPADQIIVVDNRSAGRGTAALVASLRAEDPRFAYVREEQPGLARAHNRGLEHVTTPLVAFTDDDVVVDPAWLGHLVDAFGREPAAACVTGMILPFELETAAQDWIERSTGFNKGFERRRFEEADRPSDPLFPYTAGMFGSGANMAFRTRALRALRGFDPALGAGTRAKGGDDLAAFFDVIAAGHAVAYEPGAIVFHQHHRTFEILRRQTFGYGAGLTAYLTKTIIDHPGRIFDMAARAPRAARYALSPDSAKNERRPASTPPGLVRRERLGMLVGPPLYLWSRWEARFDARPEVAADPTAAVSRIVDTPIPDRIPEPASDALLATTVLDRAADLREASAAR